MGRILFSKGRRGIVNPTRFPSSEDLLPGVMRVARNFSPRFFSFLSPNKHERGEGRGKDLVRRGYISVNCETANFERR